MNIIHLLNLVFSFIIIFSCLIAFFRINFFYSKKSEIFSRKYRLKSDKNNIGEINFFDKKEYPSISIIIPARNEEKRLPFLLENLIKQTVKPFEVIVVDDGSEDNTKKIVEYYSKKAEDLNQFKIRYIEINKENFEKESLNSSKFGLEILKSNINKSLKDWKGKSAACFYGALQAKGEFFLFFDADVRLKEDALEFIAEYLTNDIVLSIQPYHITHKPYEQFSLYSNIVVFLGLDVGRITNPYETKAGLFGPCLIIPKSIYYKTGGHFLVKDTILDDMALGIELSKRKIKLACIPHKNKIFFNMYSEGFKTLIDGWTKNMIVGAQKSTFWTILIIFSFITFSSSIAVNIVLSILNKSYPALYIYIIQYLIFSIFLYFSSKKLGDFKLLTSFTFPVFVIFYIIIFIRSFIMKILKIPINWRGRRIIIK